MHHGTYFGEFSFLSQGTMGEAARPFAPQASSQQRCIVLVVEKEPAPKFVTGVGATPNTTQMYTMGQMTQLTVRLSSPNCQANMTVGARSGTQLPEGAKVLRGKKMTLQHGTVSTVHSSFNEDDDVIVTIIIIIIIIIIMIMTIIIVGEPLLTFSMACCWSYRARA
jgi:hypothetical protein